MSAEAPNLPPTTTKQEDVVTAGQRRVNLIWEITQAFIAVIVTLASLYVAANLAIKDGASGGFLLLSNAFFLIIGFYFSRTNHSAIGGIGKKPDPPYEGR